jgi:hypothetical protein
MAAEVAAPSATALDALAAGLASQGYRIKDRTPAGFRASYRRLVRGLLGLATANDADILDRTLLCVAAGPAGPAGQETRVTISVKGGGQHRGGIRRGAAGLTAAFQDLQRRGIGVTATPWQKS